MSSFTNRSTKPTTVNCDSMGMKSLKETLDSILQDDVVESREQRRQHRRISGGARRIMDRFHSLRNDDFNPEDCYPRPLRQRGRPKQKSAVHPYYDEKNDFNDCHSPRPRLMLSNSLDVFSHSFASSLDDSYTSSFDASFTSSLDDSCRSHTSGGPQKHPQKQKRTEIRRKSIPRHRNSELNSSISSCLRPVKYSRSSSIRSSLSKSFCSLSSELEDVLSMDEKLLQKSWNSGSSSSWVASGVVIAETREVIQMK